MLHTKRAQPSDEEAGANAHSKTHHKRGRFKNIWGDDLGSGNPLNTASKILGFWTGTFTRPGLPSKSELAKLFPLAERDVKTIESPPRGAVATTWIGHSSFLVQMGGANILTDPVFSSRAEPLPYTGPWRYAPLPFEIEELPRIDIVVISHSHYDHLDLGSVRKLGNGPRWFVGLGLKKWFKDEGITNVVEMDWWEEQPSGIPGVKIACTPCKHWSARTPLDAMKSLWASWCVLCDDGTRFFFAGDTALCPVFKEIGDKYGPFTTSTIPIGAFRPREFFKTHHASPEDAVQIHLDVKSEWSVGCHWGTLRQKAHEHIMEPPNALEAELRRRSIDQGSFQVVKHGETRVVWPGTRKPGGG